MTASKIFLYFCLSFIGGILISSIFNLTQPIMLGFLILGLIFILTLWRYKKMVIVGFCILFLVLGIWREQIGEFRVISNKLRQYNDQEKTFILMGTIVADPDVREKSVRLTIQPDNINGKILVIANRYPEYQYGDKLKITGKLESPKEFEDFNYSGYLAKEGIYSLMYFPKIELLERGNYHNLGGLIFAQILKFKNNLRESIYQNLSPPQSSILTALILGDKKQMSDDLKQKLNITGIRHITAVSGLHVAVLTSILMNFLIGLGFWRQQAFYFAIILMTFFIVMTGLQPSAIRAGIMGGLFLFAQYLGRMHTSSRTIVFAAAVMLAKNPLLLKFDVGFQLSFLAMMGIIYFSDRFQKLLKFIPWDNLKSILAMSFSAYFFTLPILIYNFGYFSLIAPLTNILIVPFLYWIMIFGFIFAILGMISPLLGWIFAFPVWLLLTYLIKIIDCFSRIPWVNKNLEIHWIWLVIFYLILGVITWRLQESEKLKFLNY